MNEIPWGELTKEEKNRQLFQNQKALLDLFLAKGAISPAQYRKSYTDLKEKMGMEDTLPEQ